MAANDVILAGTPVQGGDVSCKNTSGSAISYGQSLKLDTSNPASASQPAPGVTPSTGTTDKPFGFALEAIPAGGYGRVRKAGIAVAIASGAITAGDPVGPSGTAGQIATASSGTIYGEALTTTANAADLLLVELSKKLV